MRRLADWIAMVHKTDLLETGAHSIAHFGVLISRNHMIWIPGAVA